MARILVSSLIGILVNREGSRVQIYIFRNVGFLIWGRFDRVTSRYMI